RGIHRTNLYERQQETATLDRILGGARQARGAALVLWGDPGSGKTALLDCAAEAAASDSAVLTCRGSRLESELSFAAPHELLRPVTDRTRMLPRRAGHALRAR
ncbi:AAA family ATPase, partial [Streptomyces sp. NPDC046805]|uniref:AAA family ATPase n=1 Tax=Streptomyces sp. NPDC046805 TaxID=3155134 RepID=UPI0033F4A69A